FMTRSAVAAGAAGCRPVDPMAVRTGAGGLAVAPARRHGGRMVLAGAEGLEPSNAGIKTPCLTSLATPHRLRKIGHPARLSFRGGSKAATRSTPQRFRASRRHILVPPV